MSAGLLVGFLIGIAPQSASGVSPLDPSLVATTPVESSSVARLHEGFFLRIALNAGPLLMTWRYNPGAGTPRGGQGTLDGTTEGLTLGLDLLFGGTPSDGLVIGGALLMAATHPARTTTHGDPSGTHQEPRDVLPFAGLAAFANYYFDPSAGFHVQALLGVAAYDFLRSHCYLSCPLIAPLFGGGLGYDFFVAEEWGIGPFARLLYAPAANDYYDSRHHYVLPSIGVAMTMH